MSEGDGISNRPGPASAAEPSMEEILASIRRILSEEEGAATLAPEEEDELLLDASMRVLVQDLPPVTQDLVAPVHFATGSTLESPQLPPESEPVAPELIVPSEPLPLPQQEQHGVVEPFSPAGEQAAPVFTPIPDPGSALSAGAAGPVAKSKSKKAKEYSMDEHVQGPEGLVGEKAFSEIANSVGALVRSVSAERSASIGRAGITIEDIVREEVKPVLKAWLDTHLPTLVERVVRAEINRVMDRAQD
ncbi:MAG TPA: DUF2497 domain-containing protein [Acidocella sp.]|nr:DUF2497 domain-containing protein [Acidocella sp.]